VLACGDWLRVARGEALSSVIGNRPIDDGTTVDTLPGVENEEEIGEPFQHHEAFALRAFHRILPGNYVRSCRRIQARPTPNCHDT
jgi:hypothetical protein